MRVVWSYLINPDYLTLDMSDSDEFYENSRSQSKYRSDWFKIKII